MKLVGITLIWVGVIMLLRAIGLIQVVDSSIVWAVVVIILGFALKHGCRHCAMGGMMGKCKWGKFGQAEGGKVCEQCGK